MIRENRDQPTGRNVFGHQKTRRHQQPLPARREATLLPRKLPDSGTPCTPSWSR
jgi:hypothetical protein